MNEPLTETIMWKASQDVEMRTKVVYSFMAEIHRGGGEIVKFRKMKSSTGTLSSIQDIKDFIDQCEAKRLDLEDHEFWGKAYLPAERTIDTSGSYQGMVVFQHVQVKFIASNEAWLWSLA